LISNAQHIQFRSEKDVLNRKVLVVDDEYLVSLTASLELNMAGYETKTAGNGRQALEMILGATEGEDQVPFDLLLTDINMPVMSGLDLLSELRNREIKIPVVLMTGRPEHCRQLPISSGQYGFLEKPFSPYQLVDEVGRAFKTHDQESTCLRYQKYGEDHDSLR
jgi:two-component system CheB/CheR fusion protein